MRASATAATVAAVAAAAIAYVLWRRRLGEITLCCPPGSLPPLSTLSPTETPATGEVRDIEGLRVYVSGNEESSVRSIVVASDIWGFEAGRHRQVCDVLASRLNAFVYLPDLFHGDPCTPEKAPGSPAFSAWAKKWQPDKVTTDLLEVINNIPMVHPIGIVGFCWGAYAAVLARSADLVHAVALVHPSHRKQLEAVHGMSEADVDALLGVGEAATVMLTAGNDDARCKPGGADETLLRAAATPVHFIEFGEMKHGWVIKGDVADPAVARDVQRAVGEIVDWFGAHL